MNINDVSSIKQTMAEMSQYFHEKMAEFQKNLEVSSEVTSYGSSPTARLTAEFSTFKSFVVCALKSLQQQVEMLTTHLDELEMRSRKKILLIHGLAESKKENLPAVIVKLATDHLKLENLTPEDISKTHRMGRPDADRPRPILVKFQDITLRDRFWYGKTSLKGTGTTVSEFLTKTRHSTFLVARQRFGITKCWTKNGNIIIICADGSRHRVTSMSELNAIPQQSPTLSDNTHATVPAAVPARKDGKIAVSARTKRVIKDK